MSEHTARPGTDEASPRPPGGDPTGERAAAFAELVEIRGSIDNIDAALVHLLAERFKCTQRVGRLKADHGLPAADPNREAQQIARLRSLAEESHLDPGFAEKFLTFIIDEVIHHHQQIASSRDRERPANQPTG